MKSQFFSNHKGFTVIELLVVIIIISIVAGMGTNAFQSQRKKVNYNDSVLEVLTMIKTARNYAVTNKATFDTSKPIGEESYIPEGGYGVYMKRSDTPGLSRFVLFANTSAANDITKNQFDEGMSQNDVIEDEYFLPNETVFVDLFTDLTLASTFSSNTNADENEAVIIFRPSLAEASMAANDHPLSSNLLTKPTDLYLEFRQAETDPGIPSDYIHLNRIGGLAEIVQS